MTLPATNGDGQIHTGETGPSGRLRPQIVNIEMAVGRVLKRADRRPAIANAAGQPAGVGAGQPRHPVTGQPGVQIAFGPMIGGGRDLGAGDQPHGRRIDGFDVGAIGADIADMRKGEGDQLAGVGRVGQDFLIAGHRCVEANFADAGLGGADSTSPKHRAIGQDQGGRRAMRSAAHVAARDGRESACPWQTPPTVGKAAPGSEKVMDECTHSR